VVVDPGQLADELELGPAPVRDAIWLLAHENLVRVTPRHGLYVAEVNLPDLEYLSELRLPLESLAARLAAERATADDLVVLEALRAEQAQFPSDDLKGLFDMDHKFHQAVTRAAQNRYLTQTLDRLFGLSRRLWYMALPQLGFLPAAVEKHLDLVYAIKTNDPDRAEMVMRRHVLDFYDRVREIFSRTPPAGPDPGSRK
jgi:DNA-binding GntR family transcriptional regulator